MFLEGILNLFQFFLNIFPTSSDVIIVFGNESFESFFAKQSIPVNRQASELDLQIPGKWLLMGCNRCVRRD